MQWIRNKLLCIVLEVIFILLQIANAFLSNVVIYETTTGFAFNFDALLKNKLFWLVLILQFSYAVISHCCRKSVETADSVVESAIQNGSANLIDQVVDFSKNGDFVSANKAIKIFNKLQRTRR